MQLRLFDDDIVRTISVDIRYVLFVIDKYAGATHLLDELKIMQEDFRHRRNWLILPDSIDYVIDRGVDFDAGFS